MISITGEELTDLRRSLTREWLETNGLGGYAMGTIAGANTRRYHGLLCAALRPPVGRTMLVSKLEDSLRVDGDEYALSCNLYQDAVHPDGHRHLHAFRLDPWPIWTYLAGPVLLEKSVLMLHRRNTTLVTYRCLEADRPITLAARLLVAGRDHHHLGRARVDFSMEAHPAEGGVRLLSPNLPPLLLSFANGRFLTASDWYYRFRYPEEEARGLDFIEDLYCPGEIQWTLRSGEEVILALCADPDQALPDSITSARDAERARRDAIAARAPAGDPVARTLFLAADQFLVTRSGPGESPLTAPVRSIIAGYPWFTDWGRDTLISLPGLLLSTGRFEEAREVLKTLAASMHNGLVPNTFPDQDQPPAYNTVDASLWLFVAARRYYEATRDLTLFQEGLYNALSATIAAYVKGTHFGIRMDTDGLIEAGDETTQLTWMDAKVGDWVVTPRHGKAVEINALWYSALRTAEFFARKLEREAGPHGQLARLVRGAFVNTFWDESLGYLYDCVRGEYRDASLRPNQIIACALPYSALSITQERSILRVVAERLLTPYGLRTLAPDQPGYRGRYEGDIWSRDGAYHQGTVWPWLLGPFLSASLVHAGHSDQSRRWARELLQPLVDHLHTACLGTVSEIFDGDPPHEPRGCPAQAWSVAELLRLWLETAPG